MLKPTSLTLLILSSCFIAFISLVSAQCGPDGGSCPPGLCCSSAGFCGNTPFHCGDGCQPDYGTCGTSSPTITTTGLTTGFPTTTLSTSFSEPFPTSSPTISPTTPPFTFPTTTPTPDPTTTTSTRTRRTTTTKGTFQLQPTGTLSGGVASQDKSVQSSTVALAVVFFAGMMML
ncbi:MAG: hypothetical protein J3R72DRAFT_440220 [Linnemannia gamsii]|nr:MAG: hypothetical protein J3R72DRAFT_440220 [Linnemannia gamsii]